MSDVFDNQVGPYFIYEILLKSDSCWEICTDLSANLHIFVVNVRNAMLKREQRVSLLFRVKFSLFIHILWGKTTV